MKLLDGSAWFCMEKLKNIVVRPKNKKNNQTYFKDLNTYVKNRRTRAL